MTIYKINTYVNEKNIEMQEKELVSGKAEKNAALYLAHVTIGVEIDGQQMPQQIAAPVKAKDIDEAYKNADAAIQKRIKEFEKELKEEAKAAKDEANAPQILMP